MKKAMLLILTLIASMNIYSQVQDILFDQLTHKDGLSQNGIRAIFQDHKGFIWIGGGYTQGGYLQRYDGYEFVDYRLIQHPIRNITEDQRGILWMGTENGICLLNPELEKTSHYKPAPEGLTDYNSRNYIYKITEDKNGNIWCATGDGLLKMSPKIGSESELKASIISKGLESGFAVSILKPYTTDNTPGMNAIYTVCEDSRGQIWLGGPGGLFIFNQTTHEFIRIDNYNGKSRLIHQHVVGIVEENPDVMWVRTFNGFNRISNIEKMFAGAQINLNVLNYRHYNYKNNIDYYDFVHENVLDPFLLDNQNNIWLESNSSVGLTRMNMTGSYNTIFEKVKMNLTNSKATVFSTNIQSFLQDRTGLLWITSFGSEIEKFRIGNNIFTSKEGILGKPDIRYDFEQLIEDTDGNLLVCNYGEGIFKINRDGRTHNYKPTYGTAEERYGGCCTSSILEIEKGIYLIGAYDLWQLNTGTADYKRLLTLNDWIYDLRRVDNYLLIKTYEQGLWVYDMKTRELDNYTIDLNDTMALRTNYYASINIMQNGEIWVSSRWVPNHPYGSGIVRIKQDKSTGKLAFLPLPETVTRHSSILFREGRRIYKIYEDKAGLLWFCTNLGLVRLNTGSGDIREWTMKEGLSSNMVCSIEEDNKGNLWLGTRYGLSMLDRVTEEIRTFNEKDGLPEVMTSSGRSSFRNNAGQIYISGVNGFYSINPDKLHQNDTIPPVVITGLRLFNNPVEIDSMRKSVLTSNISYTQELVLAYNQNDLSFTFAALDYSNPSKNKYAYRLEGYEDEWTETGADNRIATYTNLKPGKYIFRVKGSNNDGVWNEEGTFVRIIIHPPFWRTKLAYIVYVVLSLLLLRSYIFWRTKRLRKEKIILEKQVSERTRQIEKQKEELKEANTMLERHQDELQEVNTLLEEQQEELMQQKEELQATLENLQKTQEQLVESEKMAAIGGLVAGVAHEINTPVGIGVTAISNLRDDIEKMAVLFEKDEISRKDFREFLQSSHEVSKLIQKNLERTASLVQSFKQVSADQVTEQQRIFAFREYLDDILLSLKPKFRDKKVSFKIECADDVKLNSYPGVYAQIFTNLLINSLQHGFYQHDSGTITIKVDLSKELLKIHYGDDGAGISKKDLPHIFEPFYTSDKQRGTGLGLNIVYNLIKQKLHGAITCESEPDKGVLFRIEVPVK